MQRIAIAVYFFFGVVLAASGQYKLSLPLDEGIRVLKQELEKTQATETVGTRTELLQLVKLYNRKGMYDSSEAVLRNVLSQLKRNATAKDRALIYSELGNVLAYTGKNDQALKLYFKADSLLEYAADKPAVVWHAVNMGEFYRKIARKSDAHIQLSKALRIFRSYSVTDTSLTIRLYNRIAAFRNEFGGDSIVYYSLRAIDLSRLLGDYYSEAVSLNELGFYYKNRNRLDTSLACYKRAEDLWMKGGAVYDAVHAMYNRAMLMSHNNFPESKSIVIYKKIEQMYRQKMVDYPIENVYCALRDDYFFAGDSANFKKYKLLDLQERLNANLKRYESDITAVKEKFENDKMQIKLEQYSSKLKQTEEILDIKNKEARIVYLSLSVLAAMILIIVFLFFKYYKAGKLLEKRYREKEALVQEVHHRVKNNLQFVSSLINMQINSSDNKDDALALSDASRRIKAMSLVHEMLYTNNDEDGVSIDKYLNELTASMNGIVNTGQLNITFMLNCGNFAFTTSQSIAVGMITSELIANSIKHAFKDVEQPVIRIRLEKMHNSYAFTYSDNGPGLDEEKLKTGHLGLRLIDIFSRQLKGNYSFSKNEGLVFNLKFG